MEAKQKLINDRSNLEPETLQDLQECLWDWQIYNFGDQDKSRMLLGICEEAGELCHAQLKKEQGIRGTNEEHDAAMKDAVGDIMIYAINYLSGIDAQISPINPREDVEPLDDDKRIRDCIFTIFNIAGRIVGDVTKENSRLVHQLTGQLNYFCAVKEWNLEKIIRETWREVGQRDWKQFPKTGFASNEPSESAPESPAQEPQENVS